MNIPFIITRRGETHIVSFTIKGEKYRVERPTIVEAVNAAHTLVDTTL
jgi:hypothetical protein